jgi:OOP family OmpA-OmpF porin
MSTNFTPSGERKVRLKPGALILIGLFVIGLLYFGLNQLGYIDGILGYFKGGDKEIVNTDKRAEVPAVDPTNLPKSQVKAPQRTMDNPDVIIGGWTWQTEWGIMDSIGGVGYSGQYVDSCLAQAGVTRTRFVIQNDTSEQIKSIAGGTMHIGTTTGDQAAVDLASLNRLLGGRRAKAFFSTGFSNGEDTFLAPEILKKDPKAAEGLVVVTAVPYCDWNVSVDWATDNQIGVNPDEGVWHPKKINFVNAVDHLEAAQKYVQNAKVMLKNAETGKMEEHQIDAVATWTPGDVAAVEGRPSVTYRGTTQKLTRIISTQEYASMMPNILFADANWLNQHREYVETLTRCIVRSNDKIKQDRNYAETRVAPIAAAVFNIPNRDARFWATYFYGSSLGGVPLGGSRVNNLSEIRNVFGVDQNNLENSVFGITYADHAKRVRLYMPERLPEVYPVADVVDTSFIKAITDETVQSQNYVPKFETSNQNSSYVSANYPITFDTGSSIVKPTPQNMVSLQEIFNLMTRASNTRISIEGHTDNVGDETANLRLSKARAEAVWQYLKQMDRSGIITENRLSGVQGFGSYQPLADNGTDAGRAQNRRVTINLK